MPLNNVYTALQNGSMTLIGNSLCANRDIYNWTPYVYISTIPTSQAPGYLGNTTELTAEAFSSATLSIPTTCTVKFARLFWYTSENVPNIVMYLPNGTQQNLTEDFHVGFPPFTAQFKDVTNLINTNRSGLYTVGNINGSLGYGGWGILVAYEDSTLPFRYFNVYMGIANVSDTTPSPLTFTDFITPSSGPCKGYLLFSYSRGDLPDAASFKVGPTIPNIMLGNTSTTVWNGLQPYNKATNMFPGLICFADCNNPTLIGLLDSQSTISTRNIDPYAELYAASGRTMWDITGLDISHTLINGQTELYTTIAFSGIGSADALVQAVQIDMNSANINPVKLVDKTSAYPNEQLTYSMSLNNGGLLDAVNVLLIDTIPTGSSFVPGSLKVNGTTVAGSPLPPGYLVGTIPYGTTTTLSFRVTVTTIPEVDTGLVNSYSIKYDFTPITIPQTSYAQSNTVTTTVPALNFINIHKRASKAYVDIGEYLTYSFTIPNNGLVDVGDIIFKDTIPIGTTYISDSFLLNSVSIPGANPQAGVNLGTIPGGTTATISFIVQVNTIPTINPIPNSGDLYFKVYGTIPISVTSNMVETKVNNASVAMTKTRDLNYAGLGSTINYTIAVNTTGNVSVTNVLFIDTIPNGTSFVNGSFSVNGTTIAGSPNPPGINLGTIPLGATTVSFKVTVVTLPTVNPMPNSATAVYNYTIDPSMPNGGVGNANSNIVYTQVNDVQLTLNKSVDKKYATCSDTLKYTIGITNTGNVTAGNVIFKDTIPIGAQFISNSFTLNGVTITGANPITGVNITTIAAGSTSTVTFQVGVSC